MLKVNDNTKAVVRRFGDCEPGEVVWDAISYYLVVHPFRFYVSEDEYRILNAVDLRVHSLQHLDDDTEVRVVRRAELTLE